MRELTSVVRILDFFSELIIAYFMFFRGYTSALMKVQCHPWIVLVLLKVVVGDTALREQPTVVLPDLPHKPTDYEQRPWDFW